MKKNIFFRLSALVLSILLCLGLFAVVSFADEDKGDQVWDDEVTDTYYKAGENCGVLTFEVDAERIGETLLSADFDKDSLLEFFPTMLRDIIKTRSKKSVIDFLCNLVDNGFMTYDNMLNLFNGNAEIMDKYIDRAIWSRIDSSTKIQNAGGTKVNNALRAFFTSVLLNEVNEMKLNDTVIYTGDSEDDAVAFTFDHNAVQTALLKALPDAAKVASAKSGDEILTLHFTSTGDNVNFDVKAIFVVKGDCKKLNHAADKFVDVLTYTVGDDGSMQINISFSKPYTEAYSDLLATDKLTDARKLELLGMYTKTAAELVEGIKNEEKAEIELINSTLGHRTGRGGDRTYTDEFFNKVKAIILKTCSVSDSVAGFSTIDNNYLGNGVFEFVVHESMSVEEIVDKMKEQDVNVPAEALAYVRKDNHVFNAVVTVTTTDFYRVRFLDENGDVLYLTYLPAGESLAFVADNEPALAGHGADGWFDENGTLTEEMPDRDVDLVEESYDEYEITKTWEDESNKDGMRPGFITVTLLADDEEYQTFSIYGPDYINAETGEFETPESAPETTFSDDNNTWTVTVRVPRYINRNEVVYTLTEADNDGYTAEVDGWHIVNTHVCETTDVTVTKIWDDNNDRDGKRPDNIVVGLYANGELVDQIRLVSYPFGVVDGEDPINEKMATAEISEDGNVWTYTFTELPGYENGEAINYTVDELEVPAGYEKTVERRVITNTYESETVEITITKKWIDSKKTVKTRPNFVTVNLLANGEVVQTVVLSGKPVEVSEETADQVPENLVLTEVSEDGNTWTYTFTDLPKYDNGEEIVYTVDEPEVPQGYEKIVDGLTVTNKTTSPLGSNMTWIILATISMIACAGCTVFFVKRRKEN